MLKKCWCPYMYKQLQILGTLLARYAIRWNFGKELDW